MPNAVWGDGRDNYQVTYLYSCNQPLPDFVHSARRQQRAGILAIGKDHDVTWGQAIIEKYFIVFDWNNLRLGAAEEEQSVRGMPQEGGCLPPVSYDGSTYLRYLMRAVP